MSLRPGPKTALACLGLVAATVLAYARVFGNGFVGYDTPVYLTENPWVVRGLTPEGVRWAFTAVEASNWHPLTWISHMVDVRLFGLRPAWHAFENVLWHAANACLVLLVLLRLTGAFGRSLFVAGLFALHPLHVESVAWIVERKDVLSAFFGLLSILAWIRWARTGKAGAYAGSLLALLLGLLAKPMLVTWPFVLLLLDLGPLGRRGVGLGKLLLEKLPFLALAALSSVATVVAQRAGGAVQSLDNLPLAARIANALRAYVAYLGRTFWPAGLSFHYELPARGSGAGPAVAAFLVLAAITAAAIALRRRAPYLLAGWLFFLGTLVPVIGLVQVGGQATADRYTYLPLLGVFVAAAWGGAALLRRPEPIAAVLLLVLGFLTSRQVGVWKDSRTLAEHALAVAPDDAVAHDLLGFDLAKEGKLDEAAAHFRLALQHAPGDFDAASRLADLLQQRGELVEAQTVLVRATAYSPRIGALRRRLAIVLEEERRFEEALAEADAAVGLDPSDASALHVRAIALEALGRQPEARADLERALELSAGSGPVEAPGNALLRMRLARLLLKAGDLDGAEREIARAIAADPSNAEARRGRGRILLLRGREDEAAAALEDAVRLDPSSTPALCDLAWLRATAKDARVRDPGEAVRLAETAAGTSSASAPVLDVLAAAYASAGRSDDASRTAERAEAAANAAGDVELAGRIAKRLDAYRKGTVDAETPR